MIKEYIRSMIFNFFKYSLYQDHFTKKIVKVKNKSKKISNKVLDKK